VKSSERETCETPYESLLTSEHYFDSEFV